MGGVGVESKFTRMHVVRRNKVVFLSPGWKRFAIRYNRFIVNSAFMAVPSITIVCS